MRKSSTARLMIAGTFALALGLASGIAPVLADGGGGGGGGSGDTVNCREGMTYNKAKGICEQTSLLDDENLYEQGRALALAGYYENALEALMAVRNKDDANVLTYIGYATRKMGKVDEGIGWYQKALAIDPGNVHTHEYLGEGYVAAGRDDLAHVELAKLESLCGRSCEQYEALAAAIAGEPERWGGL
jgi:tetratricopeptide (TPR) repeat protein